MYTSLWPLPGGWKNYVNNLILILEKIRNENPTSDKLVKWAMEKFEARDWVGHAIQLILSHLFLLKKANDNLHLTAEAITFLETRDYSILIDLMIKNVWGVKEIIEWLEEPSTMKELKERFDTFGATWTKDIQVSYRLNWLMALGCVEKTGARLKAAYYLSKNGKNWLRKLS